MGDATINGDMPESVFLNHLTSYPIVSDYLTTIKNNQYGAKGIDLTNKGYATFVKPTLPYLQTPYTYTKPYLAKADQLGDAALSKIDEKIPAVKSETAEIKSTVSSFVNWPIKIVGDGKDWVVGTYSEEYKKCGGDGYVAGGKAVITSGLVLTSDVLGWISSFLSGKKAEAEEKTSN